MSRLVTFLVTMIVLLVGATMFLVGRMSQQGEVTAETSELSSPIAQTKSPQIKVNTERSKITKTLITVPISEPGFGACESSAQVVNLNPNGDNFLAVKAAPSLASRRIDKLGPNANVYVCKTTPDGTWTSVIYDGSGQLSARCSPKSSMSRELPYTGPCQSGWVSSKYIEVVAG